MQTHVEVQESSLWAPDNGQKALRGGLLAFEGVLHNLRIETLSRRQDVAATDISQSKCILANPSHKKPAII